MASGPFAASGFGWRSLPKRRAGCKPRFARCRAAAAFPLDADRIRAVDGGEPPSFELGWTERRGPRVGTPTRRGLGSRMIERNLARDLDGEARIDFHPEGVRCIIASRLDSVGNLKAAPKKRP